MYYLFSVSEDGDVYFQAYTKEALEASLEEYPEDFNLEDFNDALPPMDLMAWSERKLLIKGEIIVPKVVETVTKLGVD